MTELAELLETCEGQSYLGHTRFDFTVGDNVCTIVQPNNPVAGQRWVWKAEFLGAFPAFNQAMLDQGWWVGFMNVGNTFGCPDAMQRFDVFYERMLELGFDRKPVLEGMSRGGLYVYNWAARHTGEVGIIFGDNPVCDFKSWPGGRGRGPGSAGDWQALLKCYHFSSEAEALAWKGNPVDHLEPIIAAGIPLVHVYGDADEVVPWEENTGVMAERAKALGGNMTLFLKPGCKHHPHGPLSPDTFAQWVVEHALTR